MSFRSLLPMLFGFALLSPRAVAAPPVLTNLSPRGAERGVPVVVTLTGTGLTPATRLALPFKADQKYLPEPKPNPALLKLQLTIDPAVTPAVYPIRVLSEEGLSSLTFFRVDTLPGIAEVEDNNTFEKAQKVSWPVVIDGQCPGGDVDHFRFTARKGQHIVVEVESARLGSAVLPQLRVTDEKNHLVASDDSQSLAGDARVIVSPLADGDLIVELSDSRYRGGSPAHYRLRISDQDVAAEIFPLGGRRGEQVEFTLRGGSLGKPVVVKTKIEETPAFPGRMLLVPAGIRAGMLPAQLAVGDLPERILLRKPDDNSTLEVAPPLVINGRLERAGQADRIRFPAAPGSRWRLSVAAETLGSRLDGVLEVSDDKGRRVALADDVDLPPAAPGVPGIRTVDPAVDVTVPADSKALVVELRDQRRRGGINFGYRLTIEPIEADFTIGLPVAQLNVPRGGSVALNVPVVRRGYTGPLNLVVPNLPAGFTVQGGNVPAGANAGVLTISAATAKTEGVPAPMVLEGRATVNGKPMQRRASQYLAVSQAAGAAALLTITHVLVARTAQAPFQLTAPAAVTLVKGYPVDVPIRLVRSMGQEKLAIGLTVVVPTPPAGSNGITVKPLPATAQAEAKLTLTAGVGVPEGTLDLAVVGKARVGSSEVGTATVRAVPVTIKPPFEVVPGSKRLDLKAGQQVRLTAAVTRQPIFKDVVRVQVAGLPPGVTLVAQPKPLAAMDKEIVVELKVAPKAAPISGKLTLTCTATVPGMAYSHPPLSVEVVVSK